MNDTPSPVVSRGVTMLTLLLAIAVLYFAKVVFIPLALAILIAFLLGPLVVGLRKWGLGRVVATLIVVTCSLLLFAAVAGFMALQLSDLAKKIPEYQQNLRHKMQTIRQSGGGVVTRMTRAVHNLTRELVPPEARTPPEQSPEEKPVPVEIREAPFSPLDVFRTIVGSLVNIFLVAGIVVVFVIFMLIQREDLRDRVIRLIGARRVNLTTTALDDAAGRMSRFLLAQLALNVSFGVPVGIGLYFMGIPNPLLWALLAALLRYVPYLGIWVAALMPAALAFAVDPGWMKVPLIFALFFGVDLFMYNFAEPLLYGTSTGITPMGILVATVFWTWLWGAIGLLLATPLTVCVVVMGRHVPSLEFLSVLLSDEPVLRPETRFYQRMLAMNLEEAADVAEEYLKGRTLEDLFDKVTVPALVLAETDRHQGRLDEDRAQFLFENTQLLMEDFSERAEAIVAGANQRSDRNLERSPEAECLSEQPATPGEVICIPARDEADEVAARMLCMLLHRRGIPARALSAEALAGESIREIEDSKTMVACVAAVPPFGYMNTRYLCRRLRNRYPELKLIAAFLTEGDPEEVRKRQPGIQADEVTTNLRQALAAAISLVPGPAEPVRTPSRA